MTQASPGMEITEREAQFATPASTGGSVGGFIGKSTRGPVHKRVLITSVPQFVRVFGVDTSSYLYDAIRGFFGPGDDSAGGRCYVTRATYLADPDDITSYDAAHAGASFPTGTGATSGALTSSNSAPYNFDSGETLVVSVNGGGDLTATFTGAAAARTSTLAGTYNLTNGWTLLVAIDGGPTQTVVFNTGDFVAITAATRAEVAAKINSSIIGASAADATTGVSITSDVSGTGSSVQVVGGTAAATLGFAAGTTTGTGNVASINAVTAAEIKTVVEAAVAGVTVTGSTVITITSNTTGAGSSVQVKASSTADTICGFSNTAATGSASSTTPVLDLGMSWPGTDGNNFKATVTRKDRNITTTAAATGAGAITSLLLTSTARVRVGDTLSATDGGGDKIRFVVTAINGNTVVFDSTTATGDVANGSTVVLETFDVTFYENGTVVGTPYTDCRMSSLAGRYYVENMITNPDDPEAQFTATDLAVTASPTVDNRPTTATIVFTGGTNGTTLNDASIVGTKVGKTGFYAFDGSESSMLSAPGQSSVTIVQGLESYALYRKDVLVFVEPPIAQSPSAVMTWLTSTTNLACDNIAIAYPWIKVDDPDGSGLLITVPPSGDWQGAACAAERKANLAQSPAGTEYGVLRRARGVERDVDKDTYDTMYPLGINCIQVVQGTGVCVMGDRTLGRTGQLQYINKRRVQNYAIRVFDREFRWVMFRNNDTETQKQFKRRSDSFLIQMWRNKLLDGDRASEAFYTICDRSNNTEAVKSAKRFKARIGLRHKNSINFAEFDFEPDERAIQAEQSGL